MALTEIGHLFIDGLALYLPERGKQALVWLLLQEEEQQLQLLKYLYQHEEATPEQIIEMAHRIAEE